MAQDEADFSTCLKYIQNLTKGKKTYVINEGYNTYKKIGNTNKDTMYELLNKNVIMSTVNVVMITNMKVLEF